MPKGYYMKDGKVFEETEEKFACWEDENSEDSSKKFQCFREELEGIGSKESEKNQEEESEGLKDEELKVSKKEESEGLKDEERPKRNQGFLLRNLLSPAECRFYIEQTEKLPLTNTNYPLRYRENHRVMAVSESLATSLFARIRPFLDSGSERGDPNEQGVITIDSSNRSDHYLGTAGIWAPVAINDHFRLCKYHPGGHFSPHHDTDFAPSDTLRSLKSVMIYLNDDFEGGTTNFLEEAARLESFQDQETGKFVAQEAHIKFRVKPEAGLALVFNHRILHEGGRLISGAKYILRTEIMYERISGPPMSDAPDTSDQRDFFRMLRRAQDLEAIAYMDEAKQLYGAMVEKHPQLAREWGIGGD